MATTDFKDYYAILGVSKTASSEEIKQAFRKLARKFHPDVNLTTNRRKHALKKLTKPTKFYQMLINVKSTINLVSTGNRHLKAFRLVLVPIWAALTLVITAVLMSSLMSY